MSTKHHAGLFYIGTTAERTALGTSALRDGTLFHDTDLSRFYWWDGSAWVWSAQSGYWAPLTDGHTIGPELIFTADGDVIMVEVSS